MVTVMISQANAGPGNASDIARFLDRLELCRFN